MSARVRIFHNDYPEMLEDELSKKFGAAVEVEEQGDGMVKVRIDDHDLPWRERRAIEEAMESMRDENEWITGIEFVG